MNEMKRRVSAWVVYLYKDYFLAHSYSSNIGRTYSGIFIRLIHHKVVCLLNGMNQVSSVYNVLLSRGLFVRLSDFLSLPMRFFLINLIIVLKSSPTLHWSLPLIDEYNNRYQYVFYTHKISENKYLNLCI